MVVRENAYVESVETSDAFDREYRDHPRRRVEGDHRSNARPNTNMAPLRNYEIYDALLQIQAMILASSKQAQSPNKMRGIYHDFAERLPKHVGEFKSTYELEGIPLGVIHIDEMH